jgi:hypothetical protein
MYRIHLLPDWRELGIDYAHRRAAEAALARFRAAVPRRGYRVRPCASSR